MAQSNIRGDRSALQRTMNAILSEARTKGRGSRLTPEQMTLGMGHASVDLPAHVAELVFDLPVHRRLSDLVLSDGVRESIEEFLHEFKDGALLRAHSLEPRHTLLLIGPPGNGKTSLAETVACELGLPLLAVRYDAVVDSLLGETANRLRRLIDYASSTPCILFFDEFDAVGKERGDTQETGEIKRVVSSLLVQIDRLPAHSVVICATNHPDLLDRAMWRRFEVRLEIPYPDSAQLKAWFERFERSLGASTGITSDEFVQCMAGESMSEIEAFTLDVRRKLVLSRGELTAAEAVKIVLGRWKLRLGTQYESEENGSGLSVNKAAAGAKKRKPATRKKAVLPQGDLLGGAE